MALSFIIASNVDTSGTSANVGTITTLLADAVVVGGRFGSNGGTPGANDTASNSYVSIGSADDATFFQTQVWYSVNMAAGTPTVRITYGSSVTLRGSMHQYRGVATSSPLTGTSVNASGTSTTPASGSLTTTTADAIVGSFVATDNTTTTFTPALNWTKPASTSSTKTSMEYRIETATGSFNGQWTIDPTGFWRCYVWALKIASSGTCVPTLTLLGVGKCALWPMAALEWLRKRKNYIRRAA